MKTLCLTICLCSILLCASAKSDEYVVYDDFEDGSISPDLWLTGGGARGTSSYDPIGTGPWNYLIEEVTDPVDGYLMCRVWGPESGNTFGAEAWVRTIYNFNDGKDYLINFTWEPSFVDPHYNQYYLQITDGYIPQYSTCHWALVWPPWPPVTEADLAGTKDLLWHAHPVYGDIERGLGFEYLPSIGKVSWSIDIDSSGIARLYDSPDATGSLIYQAVLEISKPWYLRFMVIDATSMGFPAGDAQFNLYHFEVPEPATLLLLGLGGLVLRRTYRREPFDSAQGRR